MTDVRIREAHPEDEPEVAVLMASLWPESSVSERKIEAEALIRMRMCGTLPGTIFVAVGPDEKLRGFIQVGLRSHADRCEAATPVGFIEGWFVEESSRSVGIGRMLMGAAEKWARGKQCREMASDALMDNQPSLRAHSALGFEVVDRCVHLRKRL